MTSNNSTTHDIKLSRKFWQDEINSIWLENHDKDIPDIDFNWQTWKGVDTR